MPHRAAASRSPTSRPTARGRESSWDSPPSCRVASSAIRPRVSPPISCTQEPPLHRQGLDAGIQASRTFRVYRDVPDAVDPGAVAGCAKEIGSPLGKPLIFRLPAYGVSRNEWIDIHGFIKTPQGTRWARSSSSADRPGTPRAATLHSGQKGLRPLGPSSIAPEGAPRYAPVSGALDPIRSGDRPRSEGLVLDVLGPSGTSRDGLAGSSTGLPRPRFAAVKRFRARKARRSSPPRGGAERLFTVHGGENGGSKRHRSNPPPRSRSGPRCAGLTRTGDGVDGCHALSLIRFCSR